MKTEICYTVPWASDLVFMFSAHRHFFAVPRVSGPVFMFCAPGHVFGGTESVESLFHVLRSRTSFRRCRVRRVLDSFSAVSMASGYVFMFCAPGLVFMFYTPGLVFGGAKCVGSCFHVLRPDSL
jgi:hypothetical protein